jgi:hypothetical protein
VDDSPVAPAVVGECVFEQEPEAPAFDRESCVACAAAVKGRPPRDIALEIEALNAGVGKVSDSEYFRFCLFDAGLTLDEKLSFAGETCSRTIWGIANFSSLWFGPMMQKAAFCALMRGHGLPVPVVCAQTGESAPVEGAIHLADAGELAAFLARPENYPLFGKPLVGERSAGALSLEHPVGDRGWVKLSNGRIVSIDRVAQEIQEWFPAGYVFQRRLEPDPVVRRICGNRVATVRVYTISGRQGPQVFRAAWKIPAGANMADNYWRAGNILAAIDSNSGTVKRAVTGAGFDFRVIERHPESGAQLRAIPVPQLAEIEALAVKAARVFADIRLIGWDIAATVDGPVVLEGNFAPDFGIVQIAEARGVLDRQLDEALQVCLSAKRAISARIESARREQTKRILSSATA